jgi:hypothetical protein
MRIQGVEVELQTVEISNVGGDEKVASFPGLPFPLRSGVSVLTCSERAYTSVVA